MMDNISFYSHPWEERYIPTEEEMEEKRHQIIEWEKYQEDRYYQKLFENEMAELTTNEKNKSNRG
jgi:hypothetical protein